MSTNNCTYLACHETACFAKRYTQAESWKREKLRMPYIYIYLLKVILIINPVKTSCSSQKAENGPN